MTRLPNEYDLLLEDLRMGIEVREQRERMAKSATIPQSRADWKASTSQLIREVRALQTRLAPPLPTKPTPAEQQARLEAVMAKAMDGFKAGRLTAAQIAALDARVMRIRQQHGLGAAVIR